MQRMALERWVSEAGKLGTRSGSLDLVWTYQGVFEGFLGFMLQERVLSGGSWVV